MSVFGPVFGALRQDPQEVDHVARRSRLPLIVGANRQDRDVHVSLSEAREVSSDSISTSRSSPMMAVMIWAAMT